MSNNLPLFFILLLFAVSTFSLNALGENTEDDIYTTIKGPVKSCAWVSEDEYKSSTVSFLVITIGNKALYDKEGRIVQRIHDTKIHNVSDKIHYYYYDDEGKLIKREKRFKSGEVFLTTYTYDDQGRLIEERDEKDIKA